jgi:DNA-binding beta-propeller fold protein YncE
MLMQHRSGFRTAVPLITALLCLACVSRAEAREVVYVANIDGLVSAFDAVTNAPIATIILTSPFPNDPFGQSTGEQPYQEADVAVAPNGTFAYVLQYDRLFVIDTIHNIVTGEIIVNGTRLTFSPDGASAYVAGCNGGGICAIDTATNSISAVIPVYGGTSGVAVSPDGRTLYVTGGQGVSYIDTAANVVTGGTQPFSGGAAAIAVTPDGRFLYVTQLGSPGRVLVFSADGGLVATITVPRDPTDIAISPDGRSAYATNRIGTRYGPDLSAFVSVIDTSSKTVTASIPLGVGILSAFGVAVAGDGRRVYVTDVDDARLLVIDTATHAVSLGAFIPSDGPSYLAVADVPACRVQRRDGAQWRCRGVIRRGGAR